LSIFLKASLPIVWCYHKKEDNLVIIQSFVILAIFYNIAAH